MWKEENLRQVPLVLEWVLVLEFQSVLRLALAELVSVFIIRFVNR